MKPLPSANIAPHHPQRMREWAHAYGAAVRQRSVRQATTMARAGTLPEYLYQRPIEEEYSCSGEVGVIYKIRDDFYNNFLLGFGGHFHRERGEWGGGGGGG